MKHRDAHESGEGHGHSDMICTTSFIQSTVSPLCDMYIYIYVYIHVYIYMYIHIYTHTHIYIYTHTCIYRYIHK